MSRQSDYIVCGSYPPLVTKPIRFSSLDFGIYSGKQDQQKVCGFNYHSKDQLNGTFTSPNFPGFYPRDTECHYFFYGETNERVLISFSDFKVEGILP